MPLFSGKIYSFSDWSIVPSTAACGSINSSINLLKYAISSLDKTCKFREFLVLFSAQLCLSFFRGLIVYFKSFIFKNSFQLFLERWPFHTGSFVIFHKNFDQFPNFSKSYTNFSNWNSWNF